VVPDSAAANESIDFLWWDVQTGLVSRSLVTRTGYLAAATGYHDRPVYMAEAAYPAGNSPSSGTAGRIVAGGDVFPALGTFKGEMYARLEIGQRVGR
jgi:hypothetical protein